MITLNPAMDVEQYSLPCSEEINHSCWREVFFYLVFIHAKCEGHLVKYLYFSSVNCSAVFMVSYGMNLLRHISHWTLRAARSLPKTCYKQTKHIFGLISAIGSYREKFHVQKNGKIEVNRTVKIIFEKPAVNVNIIKSQFQR